MTAIASICLFDNDVRNEATGHHGLLPYVTVCFEHPYVGVRYGASLCARSFSRSVGVLRTSLFDSGMGTLVSAVVQDEREDDRVINIALGALSNLLLNFSPMRGVRFDPILVQNKGTND